MKVLVGLLAGALLLTGCGAITAAYRKHQCLSEFPGGHAFVANSMFGIYEDTRCTDKDGNWQWTR